MGAIKTPAKIQVPFAYCLTSVNSEWDFSIVANVYPLNGADESDGNVEIVSIARHITGQDAHRKGCGFVACDDLPEFILEDIRRMAVEKYEERYCEALNDMG